MATRIRHCKISSGSIEMCGMTSDIYKYLPDVDLVSHIGSKQGYSINFGHSEHQRNFSGYA